MAAKFAFTHWEDGLMRGFVKKYWRLNDLSPRGHPFWELVRQHMPDFMPWRSSVSLAQRMKILIRDEKSRLAQWEQPKKKQFVFPEIKRSNKGWAEEESSMLEVVVAAHPTINDLMPTYKGYWKAFREEYPEFLQGRNNQSLASQWVAMNRSRGKKQKRLSAVEQEAEALMEELEEEQDNVDELEHVMVMKQRQLEHADLDEMLVLIDEIDAINQVIKKINKSFKRQKLIQIE